MSRLRPLFHKILIALALLAAAAAAAPAAAQIAGVRSVATGGYHSCAVSRDGAVFCWGDNAYGQIGDGTGLARLAPVRVSGLTGAFQSVTAGFGHSCALSEAGEVWCWGYNAMGQIGSGDRLDSRTPVRVAALGTGVRQISAGGNTSCAIDAAQRVFCWGSNYFGMLGNGYADMADGLSPGRVIGLAAGVRPVSLGTNHGCAVTAAGRVLCWGANYFGQLGLANGDYRLTATRVSRLGDGHLAVSSGNGFSCALNPLRRVFCWGVNTSHQLGALEDQASAVPVRQADVPQGVQALGSANFAQCSLTRRRAVQCWGENGDSQLGYVGHPINTPIPQTIPTLGTGVQALSHGADARHFCAILRNGTLRCWGANESGQIGNGSTLLGGVAVPASVRGRLHLR